MIDYIKGEILNPDIFAIKNNSHLIFHGRYNESTGEINERKLVAYYEGLTFTIVEYRRVFLHGSLPRFYFGNNYQNLMYSDLQNVIAELKKIFGIEPENIVLQNIEVGVSVDTNELDPTKFLEDEVIDYKVTTKEINTHNGKGYTISFPLKNYVVKLYDKGRQCNLNKNVLRFEVRVKKMVHIKDLGIKLLSDLSDKHKWELFRELLIDTFQDIIICKYQNGADLTIEESSLYRKGSNQQFWLRHWPNSENYENGSKDCEFKVFRSNYYKMRSEFKMLIKKFDFDRTKIFLLSKIMQELDKLIKG